MSVAFGSERFRADTADGAIELGYHSRHESWQMGYASEATGAAVRYAFEALACPRLIASVHVDNAPSIRVRQRLRMSRLTRFTRLDMPNYLYELRRPSAALVDK